MGLEPVTGNVKIHVPQQGADKGRVIRPVRQGEGRRKKPDFLKPGIGGLEDLTR